MNDIDIHKIIEEARLARSIAAGQMLANIWNKISKLVTTTFRNIDQYFARIQQQDQDAHLAKAANVAELEDMIRYPKKNFTYW